MKKSPNITKIVACILAGSILFSSCASSTVIQSYPSGAKVYLNNEPVGVTPYQHRDTKIVGSTTDVRLEKDGYQTLNTSFSRNEDADVGAIIGGIFLLFPFLWTMKYKPSHNYELQSGAVGNQTMPVTSFIPNASQSKTDQLRELKKMLDEKLINQEDYEKAKSKILGGD